MAKVSLTKFKYGDRWVERKIENGLLHLEGKNEVQGPSYYFPIPGPIVTDTIQVKIDGSNWCCIGLSTPNLDGSNICSRSKACWGLYVGGTGPQETYNGGGRGKRKWGPKSFKIPFIVELTLSGSELSAKVKEIESGDVSEGLVCSDVPTGTPLNLCVGSYGYDASFKVLSGKKGLGAVNYVQVESKGLQMSSKDPATKKKSPTKKKSSTKKGKSKGMSSEMADLDINNDGFVTDDEVEEAMAVKQKSKTKINALTNAQDSGLPDGWVQSKDPNSGRVFYMNHKTKKTQWDKPTGPPAAAVVQSKPAVKPQQQQQKQPEKGGTPTLLPTSPGMPYGWTESVDPGSKRKFYVDHSTKKTSWTKPEGEPHQPAKVLDVCPHKMHRINCPQCSPGVRTNNQSKKIDTS